MAKIFTSLSFLNGLPLELLELGNAARNAQVGCALLSIARGMCQCKIIFFVDPIIGARDDVVDI
jgi:hypothetical protein